MLITNEGFTKTCPSQAQQSFVCMLIHVSAHEWHGVVQSRQIIIRKTVYRISDSAAIELHCTLSTSAFFGCFLGVSLVTRLGRIFCWKCRLYILLTLVFWILFWASQQNDTQIEWTALHPMQVIWCGFLGSGEFFTRTKETYHNCGTFPSFLGECCVLAPAFYQLSIVIN